MRSRGFTLVELLIVVVIIGILAAVVIPMFDDVTSSTNEAALRANLNTLRNAIERYRTEHGGRHPKDASVTDQLLGYTDIEGNVNPGGVKTAVYRFGPYLRAMPPLPVGIREGNTGMHWTDAPGVGWLYSELQFTVKAHASGEYDSAGVDYSTY